MTLNRNDLFLQNIRNQHPRAYTRPLKVSSCKMTSGLLSITPGILLIRLDRLLQFIDIGNLTSAIRMCGKFVEDFDNKAGGVFKDKEVSYISDSLFEIELLLILNATSSAKDKIDTLRNNIIKTLVNYGVFKDRMMDEEYTEDTIGTLAIIPTDVRRFIVDILQIDYCW